MIGIPKYLSYYNVDRLITRFLNYLDIKTVISDKTNDEIIKLGNINSNKDICLPLKIYIGHIAYLQNKCNYIIMLKPKEKCINYIYLKDIINMFDIKIIKFDIEDEINEFIKLGKMFNKNYFEIMNAYTKAKIENDNYYENIKRKNKAKLQNKTKKVLIMGKNYNIKEEYIMSNIKEILKQNNIDIVYNDNFNLKNLVNKINFIIYVKSCDIEINEIVSLNTYNIPIINIDITDFKKEELNNFIKTFTHSI